MIQIIRAGAILLAALTTVAPAWAQGERLRPHDGADAAVIHAPPPGERLQPRDAIDGSVTAPPSVPQPVVRPAPHSDAAGAPAPQQFAELHGHFVVEDYGPDGALKWRDSFDNTVVTVGKNLALDTFLAGSSYTVTGPYVGLISSVGYSAIAAADTMASHAGWTEAGATNAPTYTAPRKTAAWSAASAGAKALSSALSYSITGSGTIKGCFVVFGTGAVSTIDNTSGTLFSAGLFSGGDKTVANGDTVNVSYSVSM